MAELGIAVIMTCHNRRKKTLSCLDRLFRQVGLKHAGRLEVYLTEDGSTDGTADAIRKNFPAVNILQGNGHLYWNGGMRIAWAEAIKKCYHFYIWLNDDTLLYPDAVYRLLQSYDDVASQGYGRHIIAGTVHDPNTNEPTYGGVVRSSHLNPFKYNLVAPGSSEPKHCDTVNGNLVLVPHNVVQLLGNLKSVFSHRLGDFDYGLRAKANGCKVWVGPGYYGVCKRNKRYPLWKDSALTLKMCLKEMNRPKNLPIEEWRHFTKQHSGIFWPIFTLSPYFKIIMQYMFIMLNRRKR